MNKNNEKFNWKTWHYENNAPFTLFKMSLNHAIIINIFIFIMSFFFALIRYTTLEQTISFWGIILFSGMVLILVSLIPLTIIHSFHYIVFKKILLKNKLEYSILVAWLLIITHYSGIYYMLDYILDTLQYNVSAIECSFLFVGYMFGLIVSFTTFQKNFYNQGFNFKDDNPQQWKIYIDPDKKYFD